MTKELFKTSFEAEKEQEGEERERLLKERGVYYFEEKNPETKEKKSLVNIMGIKIETEATENEINETKEEMVAAKLDQALFKKMAQCYVLHQPLMIEGSPAAGKTFAIRYFTKLLYGKGAEPLTIYGTNRTDADDILGRWVPETEDKKAKELWHNFLESEEGQKKIKDVVNELKGKEDFPEKQKQNVIKEQLKELAKSIGLSHLNDFRFKECPLLKAYSAEEGKGYVLDVEELGVIPTNVQETFLPIGGDKGALAETIQFWGNGREVYKRGPKTWIVFASNPPEEVGARHEVTTPLASRLAWIRVEEEKIPGKIDAVIDYAISKGKERPEIEPEALFIPVKNPIDFSKYPELYKALGLAIKTFQNDFFSLYKSKGEKDRNQKFEIGAREALRTINFMAVFQQRDPETGLIDLVGSFKEAAELYYLDKLADQDLKGRLKKTLDEILEGKTSPGHKLYKKSLADKIKEEVKKFLDPEAAKRSALGRFEESLKEIYEIPEEYKNWIEIKKPVLEYKQILNEANQLKKKGLEEKDLEKAVEFVDQAKDKLKQIKELAQHIKEKIKQAEAIKTMIDKKTESKKSKKRS